jgi:hypothetical protein
MKEDMTSNRACIIATEATKTRRRSWSMNLAV